MKNIFLLIAAILLAACAEYSPKTSKHVEDEWKTRLANNDIDAFYLSETLAFNLTSIDVCDYTFAVFYRCFTEVSIPINESSRSHVAGVYGEFEGGKWKVYIPGSAKKFTYPYVEGIIDEALTKLVKKKEREAYIASTWEE